MRTIGLVVGGIVACVGLGGVIIFFTSLNPASYGGTPGEGLPYLLSIIPLIYGVYLFTGIQKDPGFEQSHRMTLNLLVWPSLITLALSIFLYVSAMIADEGIGIFFAVVTLFIGIGVSSALSLIGFVIENKRN